MLITNEMIPRKPPASAPARWASIATLALISSPVVLEGPTNCSQAILATNPDTNSQLDFLPFKASLSAKKPNNPCSVPDKPT
ncbi:hypothetical protein VCHA49P381_180049 [Vibrio chagasii]|nr:hypothetical protein VCHA49P381_180049 [Vibrio chagasii]